MRRLLRRSSWLLALIVAAVVLTSCFSSEPTTKAALCEKFDALGKEMLTTHILSDNAVFRRAGDMADAAERYEASPAVKAEAKRIRKIADSDSTSLNQLMNATQSVADVCGHPLGIGSSSPSATGTARSTDQQAGGHPAPTARSTADGSARVPEAFVGTWVGTGYQYDTQSRWTISMTLHVGGPATAAGRITYPSLNCGGVLTLQTVEGGSVRAREDITDGENACVDHGSIEMRLLGKSSLKWQWNHPDGRPGAEATLSKKGW